MSSNLPSDQHKGKMQDPFGEWMKSMNDFFHKRPVRGLLQSMDEFFKAPFATFPIAVEELDHEYIVSAELPGVNKEQISISIFDNSLTISVRSQEVITEEDNTNKIFKQKQSFQQMTRSVYLNHPINESEVKASYRDGLLKIKIPKPKGKSVTIDAD
jgi:HSP20 family molecular chaperone IbpA